MKRKKLGEILVEAGVITPEQVAGALEDQKRYGGKLGTILLERHLISEDEYIRALTTQLQLPAVDFTRSTIPEKVIKILPEELAEKYTVFPVALKHTAQGRVLMLAMSDPTNVEIQDQIRFTTGYKVEPVLAPDTTIQYVIRDYFFHNQGKGSYRLEMDMSVPEELEVETETDRMRVERVSEVERDTPSEDALSPGEQTGSKEGERPQLSRELKALLKILAKKGLITAQEYLDEFKDTD
jgi:type IV pilus assembly protein PilB